MKIEVQLSGPWDDEGENVEVEQAIIQQAARRLADRWETTLRERAYAVLDDLLRKRLAPLVAEVMESDIRRTDSYGSPMGDAKPLRTHIAESCTQFLEERVSIERGGSSGPQLRREQHSRAGTMTRVQALVRIATERVAETTLRQALDGAVDDARRRLLTDAKPLLDSALARIVGLPEPRP